jgi:putative peptidoglycan lipid II flippase
MSILKETDNSSITKPASKVVQENLEKRAISRSAFMVMLGGVFSILAGFVNQMIIAAYFGAGNEMDSFLTALVIPSYIDAVLLSGLSFVFIPAFVREETRGNKDAAWELVGTFFWIVTGILIIVAIAGSFFSKDIISLTAPGFSPKKSELAARMLSILMFSVPFNGLSSYTTGIQNARNSFFWPAFGGAVNSIGNILTVVLLRRVAGPMVLPLGFFVAILLQSCITIFPVLRHGWSRLMPLTDSRIAEMAKLILPFILFGFLLRGTILFERYFASALPSGEISYLGYAGKISSIYIQMLASGIASTIFPAMARAYTQRGKEGLEEKTVYGLRLTLAVALPSALITGALSIPLVKVLFERGVFRSVDTLYVAQVVPIVMMSGVLCWMLGNIITRAFYVLENTLAPAIVSTVSVVIYLCIGKFFASQWGYVGLAYAMLIQQTIFVLLLCVLTIYKLPGVALGRILPRVLVYTLAAIGAFYIGKSLSANLNFLPALINLFTSALVSGIFYLVILYFFDREMLISILEMFGIWRLMGFVRNAKSYLSRSRMP